MSLGGLQSTWVVIPAFNESRVIRGVVDAVARTGGHVVVVDDCSRDGTFESLQGSHAHRLRHPVNLGQGAALQSGITYALDCGAEFVVTFDADGQHDPREIISMVEALKSANVDIVLGSRFVAGGRGVGMSGGRRLLLKAATLFTRITTGLRLTDTHNGFRAMTRRAAQNICITQNRMAHASQILTQIADAHLKYLEYPVTVTYSAYSMEKGQRAGNAFNILWESFMGRLFQ